MTTLTLQQVAMLLGVQLEMVRDVCGSLFGVSKPTAEILFTQALAVRAELVRWGKIAK